MRTKEFDNVILNRNVIKEPRIKEAIIKDIEEHEKKLRVCLISLLWHKIDVATYEATHANHPVMKSVEAEELHIQKEVDDAREKYEELLDELLSSFSADTDKHLLHALTNYCM